jgi:hypothetical protein
MHMLHLYVKQYIKQILESMSENEEDTSLMKPEMIDGKVDDFTKFLTPAPVDTTKYPNFDIKDTEKFPREESRALICSSLDDRKLQMVSVCPTSIETFNDASEHCLTPSIPDVIGFVPMMTCRTALYGVYVSFNFW